MSLWNKFKSLITKIKDRFIPLEELNNPVSPKSHPSVREDTRTLRARQAVRKAFEQQQEAMNARALKAHDPTCPDPLTCTKKICFIRKPDKIVKTSTVEEADRKKEFKRRMRTRRIDKNI